MIWRAPRDGRPGRPAVFSDAAIQVCLSIKVMFKLPLRQTAGMVASLLRLARARLFHAVPQAEDPGRLGPLSPRRWPAEPAARPARPGPRGRADRHGHRRRRLRHTPLPQGHHRTRRRSDHPDPKERTSLERRLPGPTRPQRHPARDAILRAGSTGLRGPTGATVPSHSGNAGPDTTPAAGSRRRCAA
jgi:hypothetical protein